MLLSRRRVASALRPLASEPDTVGSYRSRFALSFLALAEPQNCLEPLALCWPIVDSPIVIDVPPAASEAVVTDPGLSVTTAGLGYLKAVDPVVMADLIVRLEKDQPSERAEHGAAVVRRHLSCPLDM